MMLNLSCFTCDWTAIKNVKEKVEQFENLLRDLPLASRVLLSWMIVHMTHVIARVTSFCPVFFLLYCENDMV